jgi:hypothetical protein
MDGLSAASSGTRIFYFWLATPNSTKETLSQFRGVRSSLLPPLFHLSNSCSTCLAAKMPSRDVSDHALSAATTTSTTGASPSSSRGAWATLVTGEKYLPGVAVFAESLLRGSQHHKGSSYPLVAMTTADVQEEALAALKSLGCLIRPVKRLHPGHSKGDKNMAFAHFGDVWTKLRAFDLTEYDRVIMVDSDMLVRKNMDELFEETLEEGHIKATFACTCNPAKNPNYPTYW